MRFKDLPVDTYFRFIRSDKHDDATVWQKLAQHKIRYARGLGIQKYLRNEYVEDLGYEYQLPELVNFELLPKGHYFVFADSKTMYQKLTTYYIRHYGTSESIYYNKNGKVQDLGEEMCQFMQPIHVQTRSVKLGE